MVKGQSPRSKYPQQKHQSLEELQKRNGQGHWHGQAAADSEEEPRAKQPPKRQKLEGTKKRTGRTGPGWQL